jgi:hypothetical protein
MRHTKFRAIKDYMTFEFAYGNLIYNDGYPRIQIDNDLTFVTCLKNTEGQYTGLKGIYENDIVSDHNGIGVVEYVEKYAAFRVNYKNGECKWFYHYLDSEYDSIEIIGNIYQTPELYQELLKQDK